MSGSEAESKMQVLFTPIEDAEPLYRYGPGGYHPIAVGDRLGDRYRVLDKLGHGSYSTVWLARDEMLEQQRHQPPQLVAVKVCTADSTTRETETLRLLGKDKKGRETRRVKHDADEDNDKGAFITTLLDSFYVHGPNGTHPCLVTEAAHSSLSKAAEYSFYAPLMLPVARATVAQLILGVAHLHRQGFVHGDLHLGNVLLQLPPKFHDLTDEELVEQFGEPEFEAVTTFNDEEIPADLRAHIPSVVTLPFSFSLPKTSELPLSHARILLADFGVSYQPEKESRLECYSPPHACPPENRFEPNKPKSFPSDIWTLACAVWAIIAQSRLFSCGWDSEDDVTNMQVQVLGKLPDEWWHKWEARSKTFTEQGDLIKVDPHFPKQTFDHQFEKHIQECRRKSDMKIMDNAEKEALLAMLRPMLTYLPEQRSTIDKVLASEWMTKYAMPEYYNMMYQETSMDK